MSNMEKEQEPSATQFGGNEEDESESKMRERHKHHENSDGSGRDVDDNNGDDDRKNQKHKHQEPIAASFFVGGRLLRQREEYSHHPTSWALRETLKKGSFVVVMLLFWHFGRSYVTQENSAAVVWTYDKDNDIFSRRLAFVQSAQSRFHFQKGDLVAAHSNRDSRRLIREMVLEDNPTRSETGDFLWKVVPYVNRDSFTHVTYVTQGNIVGRIDFSISFFVLLLAIVLFSLYTWWALSGY